MDGQGDFTPVYLRDDATVLAEQSKVVHQISIDDFKSINYLLVFFNTAENKTKKATVEITKGSNLDWTVRGRSGDIMDLEINPAEIAGNLDLSIKNNELFNINLELAFAALG